MGKQIPMHCQGKKAEKYRKNRQSCEAPAAIIILVYLTAHQHISGHTAPNPSSEHP